MRFPTWKREGYCDVVAGGSSLPDAEARDLLREGKATAALDYYLARKRVVAVLRANGGSVDALFSS